jgi:hypothetical protein
MTDQASPYSSLPPRRKPMNRGQGFRPRPGNVTRLQRNVGLTTVTPLRRRPQEAAVVIDLATRKPRVHAASGLPKLARGFPARAHDLIIERDFGCVLSGWQAPGLEGGCLGPFQAHHRDLIGMGGTSDLTVHHPANGLGLCLAHHSTWVHIQRVTAARFGLIVDGGRKYATTKMTFDGGLTWWLFSPDGHDYLSTTPPEGDDAA